jgi:cation:H+ antiporter
MIPVLEFLGGCIILAIGADGFLDASIRIAKHYKLPAVIIGIFFVGFGTSFAEIVVAAVASAHGKPQLAIGNVLGSNVANIGLVIGIAAMIRPIFVSSRFVKREFPVLLLVTLIAGLLMWNGYLSRIDGWILLILLCIHCSFLFMYAPKDEVIKQESQEVVAQESEMSLKKAFFMWPLGLVFLYISSELIVNGASIIASWLHISDLLIGLTIVAIGTSLPELATIVLSTLKKQHDVAIGTIIGSNIFNLLAVLAMPALIRPTELPSHFMRIDYPLLLVFTLLFYIFAFWPRKRSDISRIEGVLLVLCYVAYVILLIYFE